MMVDIRYINRGDGEYTVIANDIIIGSVWRERQRQIDRNHGNNPNVPYAGRWVWVASPGINDETFTTRRAAANELVRRRRDVWS